MSAPIKQDARLLVGRKIAVCSMIFHVLRYDTRRRRLIMRNVHTKMEHEIRPGELFEYLADDSLAKHIRLLEMS